jgi:hypothetical protein
MRSPQAICICRCQTYAFDMPFANVDELRANAERRPDSHLNL